MSLLGASEGASISNKTSRSIRGCPYLEHDYQLGGLRPGLGLEPWLAGPPLSTLSHALPGFLSHPQAAYTSMGGLISFPLPCFTPGTPHDTTVQASLYCGDPEKLNV